MWLSSADLDVGDERQMVRRDEREPRARELDADDLHPPRVVDVVEVQQREESGIGAPSLQVIAQVDAVQFFAEQRRRQPLHPFIEIAEDDLRSADVAIRGDRGEPVRLVAALENRGAEVHVVDVERAAAGIDVDALHAARLARLPREIVLDVLDDWKTAEDGVAEMVSAQLPGGRHDPSHAERGADLFRMTAAARPGADDFLQRNDVRVDAPQYVCDAVRPGAAVESAAAVDVVGGDAQSDRTAGTHYVMIVRGGARPAETGVAAAVAAIA